MAARFTFETMVGAARANLGTVSGTDEIDVEGARQNPEYVRALIEFLMAFVPDAQEDAPEEWRAAATAALGLPADFEDVI